MTRRAALLVLNYNGRDLLEESLPSVIRAAERAGPGFPVYVVDNASTDGSREFLRRAFPAVRLLEMPRNDYIFSYNDAVPQIREDYVVLLNNDLALEENALPPLLEPFSDPEVFGVHAKLLAWDRKSWNAGRRRGYLRRGMFYHDQEEREAAAPTPTLFAPLGASAFDRRKYLDLGGIDRLYRPYYYDDIDLSYRAWKRGWKVLYEPRSIMYHKMQATIGRIATPEHIQICDRKNNLLFFWKNITDPGPFLLHHLLLLPRAAKAVLLGRGQFLRSLGRALRQWPEARAMRRRHRATVRRSDREILAICAGEGRESAAA